MPRDQENAMLYQRRDHQELRQPVYNVASPFQDIIESDDEDYGPGPGAYHNPNLSNFSYSKKPERL